MTKLLFNQPKPHRDYNVVIVIRIEDLERFYSDFYPWCELDILAGEQIRDEDQNTVTFYFNLDDQKSADLKQMMISGFIPKPKNDN